MAILSLIFFFFSHYSFIRSVRSEEGENCAHPRRHYRTDSALCALTEETIRNNEKPGFKNCATVLISACAKQLGFRLSWPVRQPKQER